MIENFLSSYSIAESLIEAQKKNCLGHSYFIYGNDVNYLQNFVNSWLQSFFFVFKEEKISWNECKKFIQPQGLNPYFFLIQADNKKNEISIEKIRQLKKYLNVKVIDGFYRIIFIQGAHCLSIDTQNALLKIIEEPYEKTLFILTTWMKDKILPTINSRCQKIPLFNYTKKESNPFTKFKFFDGLNTALKMSFNFKKLLKNLQNNNDFEIQNYKRKLNSFGLDKKEKEKKLSAYTEILFKEKIIKYLTDLEDHLYNFLLKNNKILQKENQKIFTVLEQLKQSFSIDLFNIDLSIDNFFLSLAY